MTLGVWTLIGLLAAANVLRFAMHAKTLTTSIFMRRSVLIGWPEFFSACSIGFSSKSGRAHSPPPLISRA